MESDDLDDVMALVAADPPDAPADPVADPDPDFEDLQMICQQAPERPHRKHARRSWQLTEKARLIKENRGLKMRLETESLEKKAVVDVLDAVRHTLPGVAVLVGVSSGGRGRAGLTEKRAQALAVLAARPALAGSSAVVKAQQRAVALVARSVLATQAAFVEGVFSAASAGNDPNALADLAVVAEILSINWQWDESSQKMKNVISTRACGEKASRFHVAGQVMMQSGRFRTHNVDGTVAASEPYLCRALLLERQTGDHLLAGLLRLHPWPFEDPAKMIEMCRGGRRAIILTFGHDRASPNFSLLRWLWRQVASTLPKSLPIFLHSEPCCLHGLHLVKHRPLVGKAVLGASFSFTRLLRSWRVGDSWRRELIGLISGTLQYEPEQRPEAMAARTNGVKAALLAVGGPLGGDPRRQRKARRAGNAEADAPSSGVFLKEIEEVFELVAADSQCLCHNCYVEPGSAAHRRGLLVGTRCCKDRDEAVDRVTAAVLNVLSAKAWPVAAENRWTHASTTLRRISLGFSLNNLFGKALCNMRSFYDAPDTLEAQLAAQLRADAGNHNVRMRLRLLRVARALGDDPDAKLKIATLVTGMEVVDEMLYNVFGNKVSGKATLLDLLGSRTPVFAKMQSNLLSLLCDFRGEAVRWSLFAAFGGDFQQLHLRQFARCFLLQLSCSLYEHFEKKWSEPPYSLLLLLDDESPLAPLLEKRRRAQAFLNKPWHCCSMFLKQMRTRCATVPAVLAEGPAILRAWNESVPLGIDFVERSHAHLRLTLRSAAGPAKNAVVGANSVLVQQAVAQHFEKSRLDLRRATVSEALRLQPVAAKKRPASSTLGGNPVCTMRNAKLQAFKQARAPDRSLTDDELEEFQENFLREREQMPVEDRENWKTLFQGQALQRQVARVAQAVPALVAPLAPVRGLWGTEVEPSCVVPIQAMINEYKLNDSRERRTLVIRDPDILLKDPVPERTASSDSDEDPERIAAISSCWEAHKNVCRAVLPATTAEALDALTQLLSQWTQSLPEGLQDNCTALVLLRGTGPQAADVAIDVVVFLALRRKSPLVQLFCRGVPQGMAQNLRHFSLPAVPFVLQLATAPSRLLSSIASLDRFTSNDLALELVGLRQSWSLFPLDWEDTGAASLLVLRVVAVRDRWEPPPRAARKKQPDSGVAALSVLDLDPVAFGKQLASEKNAARESSSSLPPAVSERTEGEVLFEDFPDEFVEDMVEGLAECLGIGVAGEDVEASLGVSQFDESPDEGADPESDEELEAELVSAEQLADSVPPPLPPPLDLDGMTMTEAAGEGRETPDPLAHAIVDAGGYVSCPLPPWSEYETLGRITTWPNDVPREKRNISAKCGMHSNCGTGARKLRVVTEAHMLKWLFAGVCEPRCTLGRSLELAAAHKRAFAGVIDSFASGARSSTDPA